MALHPVGREDVEDLRGPLGRSVVEGQDDVPVGHAQAGLRRGRVDDRATVREPASGTSSAPGFDAGSVGSLAQLTARDTRHHEHQQDTARARRPAPASASVGPSVPLSSHRPGRLLRPARRRRRRCRARLPVGLGGRRARRSWSSAVACGVARPVEFALFAVARGFALLCDRGLFEGVRRSRSAAALPGAGPLAGAAALSGRCRVATLSGVPPTAARLGGVTASDRCGFRLVRTTRGRRRSRRSDPALRPASARCRRRRRVPGRSGRAVRASAAQEPAQSGRGTWVTSVNAMAGSDEDEAARTGPRAAHCRTVTRLPDSSVKTGVFARSVSTRGAPLRTTVRQRTIWAS